MSPVSRQWRRLGIARETPLGADVAADSPDRREALKLMATALTLGGVGGCSPPPQHLIPAVHPPPNVRPGQADEYSTAFVHQGYAVGVVVRHWMGRPIKVEGNPNHPASLGATDAMAQAQLLDFYNPERAWGTTRKGLPADMPSLERALAAQRENFGANRGAGLAVLTGACSSPTLSAQLEQLRDAYPEARWLHYEAISRANTHKGAALAYGRAVEPVYDLARADVILAIDSDLLDQAPGSLRYARDFALRRNPVRDGNMSRLYAVEATPTLTGAMADHRYIARRGEAQDALSALAARFLGHSTPEPPDWLRRIADDLDAHRGRALIHLGPDHSAENHALVFAINEALGARGATLRLVEPVLHPSADADYSLPALIRDMDAGKIASLFILDSNPAFTASAIGFAEAMKRVDFNLTLTPARNETSDATLWATPMSHSWEYWSDARAFDGTASVLQPQSSPLFGGIDPHHLLSLLLRPGAPESHDLVQATWKSKLSGDFESGWRKALSDGVVEGSANAAFNGALRPAAPTLSAPKPVSAGVALLLRPDPFLWDGRNAGNAWLQELPRPLTKIVWDNPALVSPGAARRLGVRDGDLVEIAGGGAVMRSPVWIHPGQADDCVVAYLGFGRQRSGDIGRNVGVDFFPLYGLNGPFALRKLDGRVAVASTDRHHPLRDDESGQFARSDTLAHFRSGEIEPSPREGPFLYRWRPQGPAAWGMSIDLNACIGCSACVVACQAENNIPVVGREQVLRQREMHWLRIDRYYEGPPEDPQIHFQPVLCMHCEQAPCEPVCPVGATMHDSEGLNVMVYNRCVGTRFCSNNCPYKVRRFNYFAFADAESRALESRNPDVTVRARGVMEKCTFCIQRIAAARVEADKANKPIGEVVTACQAACPSRAISFGNLAESESETAQRKKSPLAYALLADQNTAPRVTYEMRILNRNPHLAEPAP